MAAVPSLVSVDDELRHSVCNGEARTHNTSQTHLISGSVCSVGSSRPVKWLRCRLRQRPPSWRTTQTFARLFATGRYARTTIDRQYTRRLIYLQSLSQAAMSPTTVDHYYDLVTWKPRRVKYSAAFCADVTSANSYTVHTGFLGSTPDFLSTV